MLALKKEEKEKKKEQKKEKNTVNWIILLVFWKLIKYMTNGDS